MRGPAMTGSLVGMRHDMMQSIQDLSTVVQKNCDISDARHARDYTMCVYLLKMREYYRWAKGFGINDELPRGELGDWVMQREQLWETLEPREFECLPLADECHDPFDADAINRQLVPRGLVYSAGYGRFVKPHFFLGRLLRREHRQGFEVLVSNNEFARDLVAPPAMMLGKQIFIRRESLRRMLWEHLEEWRWRKCPEDAMGRAVASYDFDGDSEQALEEMTDSEVAAVTLHELGEGAAGDWLGPAWSDMTLSLAGSSAEMMARAVRDLLADCLVTLPALIESRAESSLHFFFANLRGMRRELAPNLWAGYEQWLEKNDTGPLEDAAEAGRRHWRSVAKALLSIHERAGQGATESIPSFLQAQRLN